MTDMIHPIIAIEGPIGAGKSTLGRWLRAHTEALVTEEADCALLPLYYEDPVRWAFATQVDTLTQRARALRASHALSELVPTWLDRSVIGDRAFARANHATQRLSAYEYRLYQELYTALVEYEGALPHAVLYLDVDEDVVTQRRQRRARQGEVIPTPYESALRCAYEEELAHYESAGGVVYRVNWNADLSDTGAYMSAVRQLIMPVFSKVAEGLSADEA